MGSPSKPLVGDACWVYVQSTGELFRPDRSLCGVGYAGTGDGRNNPAMEKVKNVGPIPYGLYRIENPILRHPMLGPIAIPLTPAYESQMFGRSHFYVHGDNPAHNASLGCIIMDRNCRIAVAAAAGGWLRVISQPEPKPKLS